MSRHQKTWLDRAIEYVSPRHGLQRIAAQQAIASYDMADSGSPLNRQRSLIGGPADRSLTQRTLWTFRETSRDLMRSDGLFRGVIDRSVENVIGPSGFDIKPNTGDDGLNEQIATDFNTWLDTCDVRREFHGWQLFRTAYREELIAGENWCELDPDDNGGDGGLFFFEGERVLTPANESAATTARNGIKFDRRGRKLSVWVANEDPRSSIQGSEKGRWYPAENLVQWWNPDRTTQSRGCPIASSLVREFDDLDDLLQYEMIAAKWLAANPVWIESPNAPGLAQAMSTSLDASGNKQMDFRPGPNIGPAGSKPHSLAPARPASTFSDYVNLMCRFVGLPLGLPLELVLLDFSKVNFASSRQLLNQAQLHFKTEQNNFAVCLTRVYRWWLSNRIRNGNYAQFAEAIATGRIYAHSWAKPRWQSPNPLQDAQAAEIGIVNSFESRTNHNRNRDVDQSQIEADLTRESAAGLTSSANQQTPNDVNALRDDLVKLARNAEQRAQEAESGSVDAETWHATSREEIAALQRVATALGAWRTVT
jgi:capsid protein